MPSRQCPICRQLMPSREYGSHYQWHVAASCNRPGSTRAWRVLLQLVLRRDGYRCVLCDSTEELEIHHLDGDWTNNAPSNLQTRCLRHNPRGGVDSHNLS